MLRAVPRELRDSMMIRAAALMLRAREPETPYL
jgi:hypothetical protein